MAAIHAMMYSRVHRRELTMCDDTSRRKNGDTKNMIKN